MFTDHGQLYTIDVFSARLLNRCGQKFNTFNILPQELKLCFFLMASSIFHNLNFFFTIDVVIVNIFYSNFKLAFMDRLAGQYVSLTLQNRHKFS